jgi:myo-inositol-1(or 4)-monophosphatase
MGVHLPYFTRISMNYSIARHHTNSCKKYIMRFFGNESQTCYTASMEDALSFAAQLAQRAGKMLLDYHQPTGVHTTVKDDRTAVTEADFAADQFIRSAIEDQFPQDGLVTEETSTVYPAGNRAVWVVDPLDGTTNFSLGLHYWGVSITRMLDGEPALAALYFPALDELFSAQRGGGARLNGQKLQVTPPDEDKPFSFFSCCSRTHRRYDVSIRYKTRILGSAAYGLSTVARGSAILAFESTPKIWDFAGSWLVTREAGGVILPLDGDSPFPLVPRCDYGSKSIPILAAATPEVWSHGRENIIPKASVQRRTRGD